MFQTPHIKGKFISLRPASPDDRANVYQWLAHSDITTAIFGPPDYPEMSAPTWEEFTDDYLEYYFDGTQPRSGRSFIIEYEHGAIGHINYNQVHQGPATELDIWMASRQFTGRGFGMDALDTLCKHLHQQLECTHFYIAPSARNAAAIRSYRKAGFISAPFIPDWFVPDYHNSFLMLRILP